MQAVKVETIVEKEGELRLTDLPVHPDQRVEVTVLIPEADLSVPPATLLQVNEEEWQRLVEMIRQSEPRFPTLDEAMNFSRGRP